MHTRFLSTILLVAAVGICGLSAQQTLKSSKSSSTVNIAGTSTLHDWVSEVETFSVTASQSGNAISNVSFTADVESIKSGKSGMDKNTYKAMNSDKYPKIIFKADKLMVNGTSVTGEGDLTIAGTTKRMPVDLIYESWSDDSFLVRGSVTFNMSTFGIDPPTAMMGAIKTGDQITINLDITMGPE